MPELPVAAVVRIAKSVNVERVGSDAAEALINAGEEYIKVVARRANHYALHAGRKTIKGIDVELALKHDE